MTLIEIRPHRWGWKAFEAPGVEPVFAKKDQAIDYAQNRACFHSGEIQFWMRAEMSNAPSRSMNRIEGCNSLPGIKRAPSTDATPHVR
jgi:hypothetical protein